MINKIKKYNESFITEGGISLRLAKNRYLVWEPKKENAFEFLEGKLIFVGAVKKAPRNIWNRTPSEKDSFKYYLVISLNSRADLREDDFLDDPRNSDIVYYFEKKEDENLIEKIIYTYKEGDNIRILYKDGKYKIEERNTEESNSPKGWTIKKNEGYFTDHYDILHYHPLTDKTFQAILLKRNRTHVCQGCGRKIPEHVKFQWKLLTK